MSNAEHILRNEREYNPKWVEKTESKKGAETESKNSAICKNTCPAVYRTSSGRYLSEQNCHGTSSIQLF